MWLFSGQKSTKAPKRKPTFSDLEDTDDSRDIYKPDEDHESSDDDQDTSDEDKYGYKQHEYKPKDSQSQDLFGGDDFANEENTVEGGANEIEEEETCGEKYKMTLILRTKLAVLSIESFRV